MLVFGKGEGLADTDCPPAAAQVDMDCPASVLLVDMRPLDETALRGRGGLGSSGDLQSSENLKDSSEASEEAFEGRGQL